MEDFNAFAAALGAGISGVRSCLILSSDGLVLGAHPVTAEVDARPARIKLAAIGEPERGFLQFGTEVWCYVRRGPYAALVVSGTAVRPGPVMDQMEQVLLLAEETRTHRDLLRPEAAPPVPAPTTKPRTPLHPELKPIEQPVVIRSQPAATERSVPPAFTDQPVEPPAEATPDPVSPAPSVEPAASAEAERRGSEAPQEVDRFSLAREFSRLLQDDQKGADG